VILPRFFSESFFALISAISDKFIMMKKYKWLIIGLAALLLITAVVINLPAKQIGSMSEDCADDGSCCEDENTCACN